MPRPAAVERLRWVAYAFVPSSLLLAVTSYITTDLAATPLFWVVPRRSISRPLSSRFRAGPCCRMG
jgi:hypothetical protein